MKYFDFLYYCLYKIITSIKREGVREEKLTAQLFTMPLFFNVGSIFIILAAFSSNIEMIPKLSLIASYVFSLSLFISIFVFSNFYFIKKQNYVRIIKKYETKIKSSNAAIIGIIYYILSFVLMVVISELPSKIN